MSKVRILSLDGGGIRGVIPAVVLEYIEKKLIEKTENPNARIADYFDFVAGTSTGGILSAFYLTPNQKAGENGPTTKYTASQAIEFYSKYGYDIFNKSKKWGGLARQLFNAAIYNPKNLEGILMTEFQNLKMRDLLKPCIITTYNMQTKSSFFFNSIEDEVDREFYVRDVLRSTSAAPTYFPPAFIQNQKNLSSEMINIDGGVFANNPSLCAYAECRDTHLKLLKRETSDAENRNPQGKDMIMISIGTGGGRFQLPDTKKSNKWGLLKWAQNIPDIMMDGSIDTVDYQMKQLFDTVRDPDDGKTNYKRIDFPPKMKAIYSGNMADASKENIENLKTAGQIALEKANEVEEGERTLDEMIDLLIANS